MKNYKVYNILSGLFLVLTLPAFWWLIRGDQSWFLWLGLVQTPLGIMQLFVGLHFVFDQKQYPLWFRRRLRNYWVVTLLYFAVLLFLPWKLSMYVGIKAIWLFGVPWIIAGYQFSLVYRGGNFRKTQLSEAKS